jgi:colicin import membrane protein
MAVRGGTSIGFYDLAFAAPSMKAALEAWGAGSNLPSRCREGDGRSGRGRRDDFEARRGSQTTCRIERTVRRALRSPIRPGIQTASTSGKASPEAGETSREGHSRTYRKRSQEGSRRLREGAEAPGGRAPVRRSRQRKGPRAAGGAKAKAQAALDRAEREHQKRTAAIQAEAEAIEKRSLSESDRWEKERERL